MEFVVVLWVLVFLALALAGVLAYGLKRKAKTLKILFRLFKWFEFCIEVDSGEDQVAPLADQAAVGSVSHRVLEPEPSLQQAG
jgi:hypothetical protein